jgi:AcrR family transcriptional regulator
MVGHMALQKKEAFKPRKIPRQSRAEQTVATILEAAALILEKQGLEAFNTNLVAQRAGVSIGSLYQYFPGKDALIVALSLRETALFAADAQGALQEATGLAALRHLIAVAVRQQLRRPSLARLLDFEENRPAIARELAPTSEAFRELIGQILAHDDLPRQSSVEIATDDLLAIVRGIVDAAGNRGEVDHSELEQRVGRAVFGYLGVTLNKPRRSRSRGIG